MKKRANELDGKTWLKNSISIWSDIRKTKEESDLKHPAIFPSTLAQRLIECYTNEDQNLVLDPFAGVGSTLIAAKELGKDSIGIEISSEFTSIIENRVKQIIPYNGNAKVTIHKADSRKLNEYVEPNSIDVVVTSPPYWDILLRKRTADNKQQRDYGNVTGDLSTIEDYDNFLSELGKVFSQVYNVMKVKSYCCVVVMDFYRGKDFYPYHTHISEIMNQIGFTFKATLIWDRRQEYNNKRPLGYPSVFYVNSVHEYILIFQKHEISE